VKTEGGSLAGPGCGVDHHPADCLCDVGLSPADAEAWAPQVPIDHVPGAVEAIRLLDLSPPWTSDKLADIFAVVGPLHEVRAAYDRCLAAGDSPVLAEQKACREVGRTYHPPMAWLRAQYQDLRTSPVTNRRELRDIIKTVLRTGADIAQVAEALDANPVEIVDLISSGNARPEAVERYNKAIHHLRTHEIRTWREVARYSGLNERSIPVVAQLIGVERVWPPGRWRCPPIVQQRCRELREQGIQSYKQILAQVKAELPEEAEQLTYQNVAWYLRSDKDVLSERARLKRQRA
jgi:hypothetical protein